jgi:hypothetical protein
MALLVGLGFELARHVRAEVAAPSSPPAPNDGSAAATASANAWVDYGSRLTDPAALAAVAQTLERLGWTAQANALRALPTRKS